VPAPPPSQKYISFLSVFSIDARFPPPVNCVTISKADGRAVLAAGAKSINPALHYEREAVI